VRPVPLGWIVAFGLVGCEGDNGTVDTDEPAASCDLPALDVLFPVGAVPNPYEDWTAAPECLDTHHDVIILLGCPSDPDGSSSACQERRVDLALGFARAGYGEHFITTGGAVHNDFVEAESLRDLLVSGGIESDRVHLEPLAEHTDENLYYSSQIMMEQDWTRALVVSDSDHLVYTAVCDANCCVKLGRLWTFEFSVDDEPFLAATYELFPGPQPVTESECDTSTLPMSLMCLNLDSRRACADDFQLDE
jgi:hypothetical protein